MGAISIWHWLIVLAIIAMVFGTSRLKTVGSDLGAAIRDFKEGMKGGEGQIEKADKTGKTIEGQVHTHDNIS